MESFDPYKTPGPEQRQYGALPDEPGRQKVKTFGIMNLVFGVMLFCCCGLGGMYGVAASVMSGKMTGSLQAQMKAERAAQDADWDAKEAEARASGDGDAADEVRDQRELWERAHPNIDLSFLSRWADDPLLTGGYLADYLSALVVNLLLAVAGLGLLMRKEWGRQMSYYLAIVKLFRLPLVAAYYVFFAAPAITAVMDGFIQEMVRANPAQPPPPNIGQMYGWMTMFYGVSVLIAGCIYPLALLIAMRSPEVKAICRK